MSGSARRIANDEQRAASDPGVSAFVGASAGSGKTTLLVNRLLRLMLADVPPGRILCLTYTRAAAAEMALRLRRVLGAWVAMPDAGLDAALRDIGVADTVASRTKARRLFATVLDLPGGMRIETIHAFCQSLLRRFPLEAALSPHFRLIEDADAAAELSEAREDVLGDPAQAGLDDALQLLAGEVSAADFAALVKALGKRPDDAIAAGRLPPAALAARLRAALGVTAADAAALMDAAVVWPEAAAIRDGARRIADGDTDSKRRDAAKMLAWLGLAPAARAAAWDAWRDCFLTGKGEPRKQFVTKGFGDRNPGIAEAMAAEAHRILAIDDERRGLGAVALTAALLRLAAPMLADYQGRKERTGLLDYDDLIARSERLLANPGAAWVLYKLDGGIDHVLLDEVQDTAPAQWRIANALTGEFFGGDGAREVGGQAGRGAARSVFAVGDRKQSIYSFQGADADAFDAERDALAARVQAGGARWVNGRLDVSFRSTVPVLQLVDAVFAQPGAAGGVAERGADGRPAPLCHIAAREGMAGAVELWPLAPQPDVAAGAEDGAVVAAANAAHVSAPQRLAETLADWIRAQTAGGTMLESQGRPLAPGDVMVLVRRRSVFTAALLKALKARGVPVGGLDRLVLTAQPAVQDLMALGEALLLPEDDLTVAEFLTSPLGGLTDDAMMALATTRGGARLWESLRARAHERADWGRAWDFFAALQRRVDHVTPHALFAEALGRLGGRALLFARLGPEAAEPVDEMLNAALAYQRAHPPSLQGFLHWLRQSGAEVKREQEAAGGAVRIMTVHGAKGQEAPLVILPDTTGLPPAARLAVDWSPDRLPLWAPRAAQRNRALRAMREVARRKDMAEHNRLLYVALTRAQDRLVICGAAPGKATPPDCWYALVAGGFDALPNVETAPFGAWPGVARRYTVPQSAAPEAKGARAAAPGGTAPLPSWAGAAPDWTPAAPPPEPDLPMPLAPSRPEDAALGTVPAASSPLAQRDPTGRRFLRGQLIHSLLQHLPALPEAAREAAALAWLDRPGHGLADGAVRAIAAETLAILAHPELAPLFGPGSRAEVPLTGVVGGSVVGGLVDRLAVLPDSVLVADFKTNRDPPADPAATPVLYLRQMAAYRAVLRGVFPGRAVRCALVWTQAARVAMLDDAILDPHDPPSRDVGSRDPDPRQAA